VIVREALAGEMDAVGALRAEAYQADNFLAGAPSYVEELRSLGADGHGTVLVAVTGTELLGTVMLETWHSALKSPATPARWRCGRSPWHRGRSGAGSAGR